MAVVLTCSFRLAALPPCRLAALPLCGLGALPPCRFVAWALCGLAALWPGRGSLPSRAALVRRPPASRRPSMTEERAAQCDRRSAALPFCCNAVLLRRRSAATSGRTVCRRPVPPWPVRSGLFGLACLAVAARQLFLPSARSGVVPARTLSLRTLSLPHGTGGTPRTPTRRGIRYSRIANGRRADTAAGMIASHRCAY